MAVTPFFAMMGNHKNAVCYIVAKGMHPFQTVNEPGFCQLQQSLDPRYQPPDIYIGRPYLIITCENV